MVRSQIDSGELSGDETLSASITLTIDDLDLRFRIEDTIALSYRGYDRALGIGRAAPSALLAQASRR